MIKSILPKIWYYQNYMSLRGKNTRWLHTEGQIIIPILLLTLTEFDK